MQSASLFSRAEPATNNRDPQQAYLAIVIGVLVAVSFLLAAAIFFMIFRHRQKKSLSGSPLPDKAGWQVAQPSPRLAGPDQHDDHLLHHRAKIYSKNGTLPCDISRSDAASQYLLPHSPLPHHATKAEYQEPYHALRFSPYYSYSTLLLAGTEGAHKRVNTSIGTSALRLQ